MRSRSLTSGDKMRVKCSAVFRKNKSRDRSAGWEGMCALSAGLMASRNFSERSGY